MSMLNLMNTAMKEAKEASSKSMFLMLAADGEQRRIRFLFDLDKGPNNQAIAVKRHVVYDNKQRKYIVDSVCGAEVGKSCRYCTLAASNKLYTAKTHFVLPVYAYNHDSGEIKLLELRPTQTVLPTLISYYSEEGSIKGADFVYARSGEGKNTKYTLIPKAPKPFAVNISKPIREEAVRAKVLEAFSYQEPDHDETGSATLTRVQTPGADLGLDTLELPSNGTNGTPKNTTQVQHVPDF